MYKTHTEKFTIVIVLWLAIDIFVHERSVQQYSYLFLSCCTIWACGITITKLCFLTLETFYGFQNRELDPQQLLWQHHHNPIVLWVTLEGRRGFVNTFWEVSFLIYWLRVLILKTIRDLSKLKLVYKYCLILPNNAF